MKRLIQSLFFYVVPIICFFTAFSAGAQVQTARNISIISNSKAYWEYLPEGYDKGNETYPLLLCIHGVGSIGDGSAAQLPHAIDGLPGNWIRSNSFPKSFTVNGQTFKFIVITPQFTNWPNADNIDKILDYVVARYRVNTNRIYMTGLSMGGGVTWDYAASAYGKRLAAIVPVCGASNLGLSKSRTITAANLPVWATHNDGDPTVPAYYTNNNIAYINQAPAPTPAAKKTIFHANTHDAWYNTYNPKYKEDGLNVYEWMLQFQKGGSVPPSIVTPAINQPPKANAGGIRNITLPTSSLTLVGSGTDVDGRIVSYSWNKISGPDAYRITDVTVPNLAIYNMVAGTYVFRLTVTDDKGATAYDDATIVVSAPLANKPPIVNAGVDRVINMPTTSLTLLGSASDPDGSITSYSWSKISGPGSYRIESPNAAQTGVYSLSAGTYLFELKAVDNQGAMGRDTVQVTVNKAPNKAPVASAGGNQTITLPANSIVVKGSGTDSDGNIAAYQWRKVSGPQTFAIANANSTQTTITNLAEGIYQFELQVTDNEGAIGKDTVMVVVLPAPNKAPIANAGEAQTIQLPVNSIMLKGSGTDSDGSIVAYQWRKVSGPDAYKITNATTAQTTVSALVQGTYSFELMVTDNKGATATDIVTVMVKAAKIAPVAIAGNDMVIHMPLDSVILKGSGSDADGTITGYTWNKISGPVPGIIVHSTNAQTVVKQLTGGIYLFGLTVTDNDGLTAADTVRITVKAANKAPKVSAGSDMEITLPQNTITLTGTATDEDGSIASYQWIKVAGPAAGNVNNANQPSATATGLVKGIYQFALKVTDNQGATGSASVQVTVKDSVNKVPAAHAGNDITIQLPVNTVTLKGSGNDTDGTIISYQWKKSSGPVQGTIANTTAAQTTLTGLVQGVYVFELTVTDNGGQTAADKVTVTVKAANLPPVARAGNNVTITLPVNSVNLSGQATDADGTVTTYNWSIISGPSAGAFSASGQPATAFTGLVQGTYKVVFTATDNDGATAKDTIQITVSAAPNKRQVVSAGADITIALPINTIVLNGTASDSDGSIVAYQWKKIAGPDAYTIANANTAQTQVTGLAEGIYTFQLSVRDNNDAMSADTMQVMVKAAPNKAPVANAGGVRSVTLPTSSVTLLGSGTDTDGRIVSYSWSKIGGPDSYRLVKENTPNMEVYSMAQGTYTFRLTVTDDKGATAYDDATVMVKAAPNKAPVANAGIDQTIQLPSNTITLNGSGSDADGRIVSYIWTKISGPATGTIEDATSAQTKVKGLTEGIYVYELKVTDNGGLTATNTVRIVVKAAPNKAPKAYAGKDISITLPVNTVTLSGTGSDEDGTIATYRWTKVSGPAAGTFNTPSSAQTTITNLAAGQYIFELTVTDNQGAVDSDSIMVTVNQPANKVPVANAGANQTIQLPVNTVTLTGNGTDSDGTIIRYQWQKVSGPANATIATSNQAKTVVSELVEGTYQFELTVTDNDGATAKSVVNVMVKAANKAPTAFAGNNMVITLPANSVQLNGMATDEDGTIARYQWTKVSGPAAYTMVSAATANTMVNNLVAGIYQFALTVTDNQGAIHTATVQVTVNNAPSANQPPVVNAGADRVVNMPTTSLTLLGSASDADGSVVSYKWSKISGPESYRIESPNAAQTGVYSLSAGIYQFELQATDNQGATGKATVQVRVNPAPNKAPIANAGSAITIQLPVNSITLTGTAADSDGTIASVLWTKISGPEQYTITNSHQLQTRVTDMVQGIYSFQLKVTDNAGAMAMDTVQITVNRAPNMLPTVTVGNSQTITLPVNSIVLNGSASDKDGLIVSYLWKKISGPGTYIIINSNKPQTAVNNLTEGIYTFELTVTDNEGAIAKDAVQITVLPALNQVPVANAGAAQTIQLPNDKVTLNGSGTDAGGTIVSYQWTKISGPQSYSITNAKAAQTTVTNLTAGTYQFVLTVTDNKGATASDTVHITVVAEPVNQLPVAYAGNDITITLPVNSITLKGSGTDKDGSIVSYQWTKIYGPQAAIAQPAKAETAVTGLVQGVYLFQLQVTDNRGGVAAATIQVIVNAAPNKAPVATACGNQTIQLPVNTVTLKGSGIDSDGTIVSYQWRKISGPAQGTITDAAKAQTTITGLVQGTYVFELKVTDNGGLSAADTMQVMVNPAPNKAPVANAGYDQVITLPANAIILNGSGTDEDGTIASYQWTKISGPVQGTIVSATKAQTTVIGLIAGTYQFALKVTDNEGLSAIDTMQLIVNEALNQAPEANAGEDQTIQLPNNTITLNGSGSDADGRIASYIWKSLGVQDAVIRNPNSPQTAVTGLKQGIYLFELTVTDNRGAVAKDTVKITVDEAPVTNIQLSAFPNPVVNEININVQAPVKMSASTRIRIMDMNGKTVYHESYVRGESKNVKKIDVRSLRSGVYFVEVSVGFISKTVKIVKN